jgi:hypothetical protein
MMVAPSGMSATAASREAEILLITFASLFECLHASGSTAGVQADESEKG